MLIAAPPFAELPFTVTGGAATCLRATGTPGELTRWAPGGMRVLRADANGLTPVVDVHLGAIIGCPGVAADPDGAAVMAAPVKGGLRVALRAPGGRWSAPVTLPSDAIIGRVRAAVSSRGDAVLAWYEYHSRRVRIRAVLRPAGGAFGKVETLVPWGDFVRSPAGVDVGMSADGEALLAVGSPRGVMLVSGLGAFSAPRVLDPKAAGAALAVAPNGRVLVAAGKQLFERPPGGEFVATQPLLSPPGAIAVRDDGAAALAWFNGQVGVTAMVRAAGGTFGAPAVVAPATHQRAAEFFSFGVSLQGTPPSDEAPGLQVALGADGRPLITWPAPEHGLGFATTTAHGLLGSPLREASGISPLLLADGRFAVAWSDEGRFHLALEGATPAAASAAPGFSVGSPVRRALRPADPLELPVSCTAACDIRANIKGYPANEDAIGTLSRAGTLTLAFRRDPFAAKPGALRVIVRVGAPGAATYERRTVPVRLRVLPDPAVPHLLDVSARRAGTNVIVSWRTDASPRDLTWGVIAADGMRTAHGHGLGRTRFRIRLRDAAKIRSVRVYITRPGTYRFVEKLVRVR